MGVKRDNIRLLFCVLSILAVAFVVVALQPSVMDEPPETTAGWYADDPEVVRREAEAELVRCAELETETTAEETTAEETTAKETTAEETTAEETTTATETEWYKADHVAVVDKYPLELSDADGCILQQLALAEAQTEGVEAMALVMLTVLNRVADDDYPNTIAEVVWQDEQYSVIANGTYYNMTPNADSLAALDLVLNGWDESYGAEYFATPGSTWHESNLTYLFKWGNNMIFYCDMEG